MADKTLERMRKTLAGEVNRWLKTGRFSRSTLFELRDHACRIQGRQNFVNGAERKRLVAIANAIDDIAFVGLDATAFDAAVQQALQVAGLDGDKGAQTLGEATWHELLARLHASRVESVEQTSATRPAAWGWLTRWRVARERGGPAGAKG
ncbi:MAG: hypothetical protein JWQ11_2752 [Rhizobacter sp.]|nr:hypothetical protein [Rhizobacter sp.]